MAEKSKAVLALSGGLDSAVMLADAVTTSKQIEIVLAVNFQYGSKHQPYEGPAAKAIAAHYGVPLVGVPLKEAFYEIKSALLRSVPGKKLSEGIPDGHYQEQSMKQTVVPGRNLIFIAFLAGIAESIDASMILIGAHAGDHYIYPDCRPGFIQAASAAVHASTECRVIAVAPYIKDTKADLVKRGLQLNVPFHLTRTCYKPQSVACGRCGACQERLEAFAIAGAVDPIDYHDRTLLPKPQA